MSSRKSSKIRKYFVHVKSMGAKKWGQKNYWCAGIDLIFLKMDVACFLVQGLIKRFHLC